MSRRSVGDILQRGGTVLKTARCPEFETERGIKKAVSMIETLGLTDLCA